MKNNPLEPKSFTVRETFLTAILEVGLTSDDLLKMVNELNEKTCTLQNFDDTLEVVPAYKLSKKLCFYFEMIQYGYQKKNHHQLIARSIHEKEYSLPMTKEVLEIYERYKESFTQRY